jgi:hypothetical protein
MPLNKELIAFAVKSIRERKKGLWGTGSVNISTIYVDREDIIDFLINYGYMKPEELHREYNKFTQLTTDSKPETVAQSTTDSKPETVAQSTTDSNSSNNVPKGIAFGPRVKVTPLVGKIHRTRKNRKNGRKNNRRTASRGSSRKNNRKN